MKFEFNLGFPPAGNLTDPDSPLMLWLKSLYITLLPLMMLRRVNGENVVDVWMRFSPDYLSSSGTYEVADATSGRAFEPNELIFGQDADISAEDKDDDWRVMVLSLNTGRDWSDEKGWVFIDFYSKDFNKPRTVLKRKFDKALRAIAHAVRPLPTFDPARIEEALKILID